MVFLSPWYLLALFGVAVPIVIHLAHRRKVRNVRFPSVMLLEEIVKRYRSRRRIEEWAVLALRCLAVGFLALGFARPALRSAASLGPNCACVVILDDTYSMAAQEEQRLFTAACDYAKQVFSVMTRRDRVALIKLSDPAHPISSPDPSILVKRLENAHPTAQNADLQSAVSSAIAFFRSANMASNLLVIIGDSQACTYSALNQRAVRDRLRQEKVFTLFVNCSAKTPPNAAITALSLQRDPFNPKNILVSAAVKSFCRKALPLRCEVVVRSRKAPLAPFSVPPKAQTNVTTPLPASSLTHPAPAYMRINGDALDADNTFYFVAGLPVTTPVLLVNGDPSPLPELDECFYLRFAICPRDPNTHLPLSDFAVDETDVWGLRGKDMSRYGAVVVANVRRLDATSAKKLVQFLKNGGGVLVFFGERTDVSWWDSFLKGVCGVGVGEKRSFGEPARLGRVVWEHKLFAVFADLGGDAFSALRVRRVVELKAKDGVLAQLEDGTPFLVEAHASCGHLLLCATTADRDWTNLPLRPMFLPLLFSALNHIAKRPPSPQHFVGETVTLTLETSDALVVSPSGKRRKLAADEDGKVSFVLDEAGVWRLKATGKEFLFAANLRRGESDLQRVRVHRIAKGLILARPKSLVGILERMRGGVKLWGLMFLLAAAALFAELLLANRRLPGLERKQ